MRLKIIIAILICFLIKYIAYIVFNFELYNKIVQEFENHIQYVSNIDNGLIIYDAQMFSRKKIVKICIQNGYMTEEYFNKITNLSVDSYSYIGNDCDYYIWFIFSDGSSFHTSNKINIPFIDSTLQCIETSKIIIKNKGTSLRPKLYISFEE